MGLFAIYFMVDARMIEVVPGTSSLAPYRVVGTGPGIDVYLAIS